MHLFVSPLNSLLHIILTCADQLFRRIIAPAHTSLLAGMLTDLPRSRAELLAENALLRHQLLILPRQVKRPLLHRRDRFWLRVLARRSAPWQQARVSIQPDTLLHWHRQGFRLFWKCKSRSRTNQSKIGRETIDLIQPRARDNCLWGQSGFRGNS